MPMHLANAATSTARPCPSPSRRGGVPRTWRHRILGVLSAGLLGTALSGCDIGATSSPGLDQSEVCIFSEFEAGAACRAGQLMFFRPQVWGNAQLPLVVIAVACDFRHPILHTEGGVVCVKSEEREVAEH